MPHARLNFGCNSDVVRGTNQVTIDQGLVQAIGLFAKLGLLPRLGKMISSVLLQLRENSLARSQRYNSFRSKFTLFCICLGVLLMLSVILIGFRHDEVGDLICLEGDF